MVVVSVKVEPADADDNLNLVSTSFKKENGDVDQNPPPSTTPRTSYLNWRVRALGKTRSVVQTLQNRQLGLPFYSRSEDTTSNFWNEKAIGRQLVSQRAKSVEDYGDKSITPSTVTVKQKRKGQKKVKKPCSKSKLKDWVQLDIDKIEKTELGIADTRLWTRTKEGQGPNAKFVEKFFALDAHNFEFTLVDRLPSFGKLKKTALLESRSLTSGPAATYLLTLMEPCHLRAYDISKSKVTGELKLSLDITTPPLKGYTELEVCDSTAKIFVMGTVEKKLVKVIVILDYPPKWTKVGMIFIDELPLKLGICDGLCYILQDKKVHLTTWPFLMAKVNKSIPATGKSPAQSLAVQFEGRLREMPKLINTIQLETDYFGLIDTEVPLIFGAARMGMRFYRPIHCDHGFPPKPVYEFYNMGTVYEEDPVEVFQLPDNSPRVLICTQVNQQYEVVTFKTERVGDTNDKIIKSSISHPFNYWDELKTKRNAEPPPPSMSGRPRRTCVNNNVKPTEKKSILGITYCGLLDIIAVLTADDEEFMVVLYDPLKLSVFKALPPVRAWPPGRHGDPNQKREGIQSVDFAVEPDFVFIEFEYSNECKPPKEVFCFRLMSESNID